MLATYVRTNVLRKVFLSLDLPGFIKTFLSSAILWKTWNKALENVEKMRLRDTNSLAREYVLSLHILLHNIKIV